MNVSMNELVGTPCPCGRKPRGRNGQRSELITHVLKSFGVPDRFTCATCAEEAPFTTLIRRIKQG